jgi:hypothetical protein
MADEKKESVVIEFNKVHKTESELELEKTMADNRKKKEKLAEDRKKRNESLKKQLEKDKRKK